MLVVVGSKNQPKQQAAANAFAEVYPDERITVETVAAESGVSSHPVSASESLQGAINRTRQAVELVPGADYYVGIEGGLLTVDKKVWELGWVAIQSSDGELGTAPSAGVEMRGELLKQIHEGEELNHILEKVFGIADIGQANGFYGLTTNNLVTRQAAYRQAIIFALAPFTHSQYFK